MEFPVVAVPLPQSDHQENLIRFYLSCENLLGLLKSPQGLHTLILKHVCPIAICQSFWFNIPTALYDMRQSLPQLSKCLGSMSPTDS